MAANSSAVDPERPWSELSILVISADPFAVESLVTRLEELGAQPAVLFAIPSSIKERPHLLFFDPKLADLQPEETLRVVRSTIEPGEDSASPGVFFLDGPLAEAVIERLREVLSQPSGSIGDGTASCIRVLPQDADLRIAIDALLTGTGQWPPPKQEAVPAADGPQIRVVPAHPEASPDVPPAIREEPIVLPLATREERIPPPRDSRGVEVEDAHERSDGTARTLRAVVTVLAVSALLWVVFSGLGSRTEPVAEPLPASPPADVPAIPAATTPDAMATQLAQLGVGTAELGGRVTRADTGGSIGGATVVATGPSGPVATITDSQGRFRFSGLKGGTYVVVSSVPRFVARQVQVVVPEGGAVEDVHLRLDPEGS